ncbi:DUF1801 domain-containing protein [Streptococcus gallolyticus]|nr:DUF1801 domain-containing protein [Streptococcus gallolyticus]MBY5041761.1 DUF1801 domain-containing protein [Streptococcus gallolyticus]
MKKMESQPELVEQYIASCPEEIAAVLKSVRQAIQEVLPEAVERFSYGMPTYWYGHNLIQKAHLGLYPGARGVEHFAAQLVERNLDYSKGTIKFPYDQEIPLDFIQEIVRWTFEEEINLSKVKENKK